MGCFIPPLIGPADHLFEQAASIQMVVGPFTVRPDGIKDDHAARQYIGQVVGIIRMIETTSTGKTLVGSIQSYKKPVLVFPLTKSDDDDPDNAAYAWVYPRMGLFPVIMSFSPLFGQRLRKFLDGGDPDRVFAPQEVVVHELVHVARAASGNFGRLGDDEEELAVMVANMFSMEIGRPPINNYDDMENVTGDVAAFSKAYLKTNFDMIAAFCSQNRQLATDLSYTKVAFNPLRQYIDENL